MAEMLACARETLKRFGVEGPVDVIGHSMGGLCALAFAVEHPDLTRRLVLIGSMSGFPAAARWGMPGSSFSVFSLDYWRVIFWGIRVSTGRGSLALHKKLQNLMASRLYYDETLFSPVSIEPDDHARGVPARMIWSRNMWRRLSYVHRLVSVEAPTLVCVGRYDAEAPVPCSEELDDGLPDSRLVIFEHSGHLPFLEETRAFAETLESFLGTGAEGGERPD
jgi:proline iminopeptidase